MNDILKNKICDLYNHNLKKVFEIKEIFEDYYGEDKIDLQGYCSLEEFSKSILIHSIYTLIPKFLYDANFTILGKENPNTPLENITNNEVIDSVFNILMSSYDHVRRLIIPNKCFILIYFPEVKVTNEYDKFVFIKDLYTKVVINTDGTCVGTFTLNRSTYSTDHIISDYMHSHINGIPVNNVSEFKNPCLGTGPIRNTLSSLSINYDKSLWQLLCLEIDKYVHTESISGIPYRRLESIGINSSSYNCNADYNYTTFIGYISYEKYNNIIKEFIKYLIKSRKLKFSYIIDNFVIGMSYLEYIITVSNEFITWYNDNFNENKYSIDFNTLVAEGIINSYIIHNNKIYTSSGINHVLTHRNNIGKVVCRFKGKDILFNITDTTNENTDNSVTLLNFSISNFILSKIIQVLNYKYGRSDKKDNRVNQNVFYL